MVSVKQGIKYHFWVFGMIQSGIEPQSPGPCVNTRNIRPMSRTSRPLIAQWLSSHKITSVTWVQDLVEAVCISCWANAHREDMNPITRVGYNVHRLKINLMTSYMVLMTFEQMGSKHCNTDRRSVLTVKKSKNKTHLITFNESTLFSSWIFWLNLVFSFRQCVNCRADCVLRMSTSLVEGKHSNSIQLYSTQKLTCNVSYK